ELERVLREHPQLHPDGLSVRFIELAASSLNVEVVCFFATRDADEFSLIRQELLLTFLHIVEKAGTRIAFPTRTVHLQTGASGAAA
ncbi:MAG: MscS Mechanosensitive ion channel, partial [Polyangiaceae bacterium]|nr:MscS Mechanosensitive ion channel [Polyangiaceae bacterium]